MYIAKPFRHIIPGIIAFSSFGYMLALRINIWITLICFLLLWILSDWFINAFINAIDLWMRRQTKDTLWLRSAEGREWLKTEQGQQWREKTGYNT
jgi:hypothetical protein